MLDILIIEDDNELREMLSYLLSIVEGFNVDSLATGEGAIEHIESKKPRLILLDIQLPGQSGLEILSEVKRKNIPSAIIMMTANDSELCETNSLVLGAHDYVSKPIRSNVLVERIKRQLSAVDKKVTISCDSNNFYLREQDSALIYNDIVVSLIPSEYELVEVLIDANMPMMVSDIFEKIHGFSYHVEDRSIYMRISSLRKKLLRYLPEIQLIKNRRAKGFYLAHPVSKL
ncbi:transcriptional regulator [Vibrio sp. 10N.286.55.E10]|uniref:response regulator transcription factor n=1 Tax=unclassified Vibrio TaxID=2614977 RepID=UPI000C8499F7|nr:MULTISPECIES: response regulator transcription factor [unclassified Vibrio]PME31259.1 transcriptional regulator [Vibrio sp. 10N.286.55.E12]PME34737.1 transcriptional regulator [Vibrio sp. 10N.286.55.E10]PME67159.1 transcriptional regulator [Vibrio sp. 10N.286.55.C11]PTP17276.1 DNA-binding response regulator [Vibrio sp. 10N.286.51.C3]TKE60920.1 response regulator transcription factor [Vibrio sp. F12]